MRSMYFEDFQPGQTFESTGRTITEADLTLFSMLSGDWNPIHADAEFAKGTRYGQRVVHGALGIAISTRCDYCIAAHVAACLKAGASREEMMEVCGVAILMGGGPSYTYTAFVLDCIDALQEKA